MMNLMALRWGGKGRCYIDKVVLPDLEFNPNGFAPQRRMKYRFDCLFISAYAIAPIKKHFGADARLKRNRSGVSLQHPASSCGVGQTPSGNESTQPERHYVVVENHVKKGVF